MELPIPAVPCLLVSITFTGLPDAMGGLGSKSELAKKRAVKVRPLGQMLFIPAPGVDYISE
jgi:hypothetical protein